MVSKICAGEIVGDMYQMGLVVLLPRMRDFAPLGTVTWLLFWVLQQGYRRDARTDFDAKYVKLRDSAQRCASWGVAKPISKVQTPNFQNKPSFWTQFRQNRFFSPENLNI